MRHYLPLLFLHLPAMISHQPCIASPSWHLRICFPPPADKGFPSTLLLLLRPRKLSSLSPLVSFCTTVVTETRERSDAVSFCLSVLLSLSVFLSFSSLPIKTFLPPTSFGGLRYATYVAERVSTVELRYMPVKTLVSNKSCHTQSRSSRKFIFGYRNAVFYHVLYWS